MVLRGCVVRGEFFHSKLPGGLGTESKESRMGSLAGRAGS